MNRTLKEATVRRFYYESHEQLRRHLANFVSAYNFGRRLKTLKGLTAYEFICKGWTSNPEYFSINPLSQIPGPNRWIDSFSRTLNGRSQWTKLEPFCLGKPTDPRRTGGDNRLFLEAVLWIARTSSPWRDLPPAFGNWNTVFKRYRDWGQGRRFQADFRCCFG